ncbi:MAG TPA: zinc ribbon domain-containing protein [Thermoplasmata archaeon]|jgi:uncharacterized OB-fold protein|nr:zinc ribbon domain-containing protein [Thermoplasmata archaeon]
MPLAITHGAVARPSGRLGPLAVEAPDEDVLTLAVAAAEALPASSDAPATTRIDLVGDFPAEAEWEILEALGLPGVAVHRSPGGPSHLFEALLRATDRSAHGSGLVLAVDRSAASRGGKVDHGALAIALRATEGPGIVIDSVRTDSATPSDAKRPLRLPHPTGSGPVPLFLLGQESRVTAASAAAGELGYSPAIVPRAPPGTGPAPTAPYALALRAAPSGVGGPAGFVIAILGDDRDVTVRGRVSAAMMWFEAAGPAAIALSAPPAPDDPTSLDARAEGAYVPRPRYLENLPSRWRLVAERCGVCGRLTFPARGACAACGSGELTAVPLARTRWRVEAATTVHPGAQPTEFDRTVAAAGAYSVVVARSSEGPRATFQVAGPPGTAPVGTTIAPVLRRLYPMEGEWRYGRKAVPVGPPAR